MNPRIDNVPEKITAHTVRRIRACSHCKGIGVNELMVHGSRGHDADLNFHTKCYVERYGFEAVLGLPRAEQAKFRVCDLNIKQMRKLVDILAGEAPCKLR